MDWNELLTLVIGIVAVVASISWGVLLIRMSHIWRHIRELQVAYRQAVADGVITDAEKTQIGHTVLAILSDAINIWQVLDNLYRQILVILSRRR